MRNKLLNYLKSLNLKRFLKTPKFIDSWLIDIKKYGVNCYSAFKFMAFSVVSVFFFILSLGFVSGRLQGNLDYLIAWGQFSFSQTVQASNDYFLPDIFKTIALCESGGSQFDQNGRVVRGRVNRHDIGLYQINEVVHRSAIKTTGHDIYTEAGNTAFAAYLYETSGLHPWRLSKSCWRSAL